MNKNTGMANEKPTDTLNTQSNVQERELKEDSSDKEIISHHHVENTPFTIVTVETGSFVATGNHRLTDIETYEECERMINERDWRLTLGLIAFIVHEMPKIKKEYEQYQEVKEKEKELQD